YGRGERKVPGGALAAALAFRQRCWKTVHETRRLIDYLLTRSDIDGKRIYLVGASYGAITGVAALAQEDRIQAAILVVGGGDLPLLLKGREAQQQVPRWMAPLAARLLMFWLGPAEPLRHAPRVVQTPVLMQNGLNDSVVIPESGRALFAALGGPKEIRWYPIDHPDREKNGAEVLKMLAEALAWLQGQDAARRDRGE
ncbi:MAG: prolyl oligopeptidase family serine peptidase, partial [Anaerolineae bacterium]|nr:prolyl oligopeptidase family serine peptidase [Anaerolineae bacterium]